MQTFSLMILYSIISLTFLYRHNVDNMFFILCLYLAGLSHLIFNQASDLYILQVRIFNKQIPYCHVNLGSHAMISLNLTLISSIKLPTVPGEYNRIQVCVSVWHVSQGLIMVISKGWVKLRMLCLLKVFIKSSAGCQ